MMHLAGASGYSRLLQGKNPKVDLTEGNLYYIFLVDICEKIYCVWPWLLLYVTELIIYL